MYSTVILEIDNRETRKHEAPPAAECEDLRKHSVARAISGEDWARILPLLKENEESFGVRVEGLLNVDEVSRRPEHVYRKVVPIEVAALAEYGRGMCIQSKAKNEIPPDYP